MLSFSDYLNEVGSPLEKALQDAAKAAGDQAAKAVEVAKQQAIKDAEDARQKAIKDSKDAKDKQAAKVAEDRTAAKKDQKPTSDQNSIAAGQNQPNQAKNKSGPTSLSDSDIQKITAVVLQGGQP